MRLLRPRRAVALVLAVAALSAVLIGRHQPAHAVTPPVVAVVGDSYTAGDGSTCNCQSQAWFRYTARDLGWSVGNVIANPGAGFQQAGVYGTLARSLRDHPIPSSTAYVLVQGGLNDAGQNPAAEPAAVADLLAVVHQEAPNAVPIVIGAFDPIPDHYYGAHHVEVARRIGDSAAIGASTRYTVAFMCTYQVGPDSVHPTTTGQQQIGDWVAWHLAHGLDNGTPLRKDPSGAFYTV